MAGTKSNQLNTALLNHVLRNSAFSPPATNYLALYTVSPAAGSDGTEVTGGAYARQAIGWAASVAGSGLITTSADIVFPVATGSWGTIVAWAVCSASVGTGTIMYWGSMNTNRTIGAGEQIKFSAGQIGLYED